MPVSCEAVPAELFMEHAGIKIYHTYKDDDVNQGARICWFTTEEYGFPDQGGDYSFDVRYLPDYAAYPGDIQTVIRMAIDKGIITKDT